MKRKTFFLIIALSVKILVFSSNTAFSGVQPEFFKLDIKNFTPISEIEKADTACFRIFAQSNKFNDIEKHAIIEETRIALAKITNKKEAVKKEMEIKFKYFLTDAEIKKIQNNFEDAMTCKKVIDFYWGTAFNFRDVYEKDMLFQADDALGWAKNNANGENIIIFTKYTFAGRIFDGPIAYVKPLGHTILHELMHYSVKPHPITAQERLLDSIANVMPRNIENLSEFE